jgi:hypothetical protein
VDELIELFLAKLSPRLLRVRPDTPRRNIREARSRNSDKSRGDVARGEEYINRAITLGGSCRNQRADSSS